MEDFLKATEKVSEEKASSAQKQKKDDRGIKMLEAMSTELDSMAGSLDAVRSHHNNFVSQKLCAVKELEHEPEAGVAAGHKKAKTLMPIHDASLTRVHDTHDAHEAPKEPESPRGRRRRKSNKTEVMNRQQEKALALFNRIDEGRVDRDEVFESVQGSHKRVDVKVKFYRHRGELVLPRVEDRFMVKDRQTGCLLVDVPRLIARQPGDRDGPQCNDGQNQGDLSCSDSSDDGSPRSPRSPMSPQSPQSPMRRHRQASAGSGSRHDSMERHGSAASFAGSQADDVMSSKQSLQIITELQDVDQPVATLTQNGSTKALMQVPSKQTLATSTSRQTLSVSASQLTLSMSPSVESFIQRTKRIAEMAHLRDVRIETARSQQRRQLELKRLGQFEQYHRRQHRQEAAGRDRTLLTWVVVAISAEVLGRIWDMAGTANTLLAGGVAPTPRRGGQARMTVVEILSTPRSAGSISQETRQKLDVAQAKGGAARAFEKVRMMSKLSCMLICQRKEQAERRKVAEKKWFLLLRAANFIIVLKRRFRKNQAAEAMKSFIEAAWRGYQIRAAMRAYLKKVLFLQRAARGFLSYREHIVRRIYMPTVWEEETIILGKALGMPFDVLNAELTSHRRYWEKSQRILEATRLSEVRSAFLTRASDTDQYWNLAVGQKVEVSTTKTGGKGKASTLSSRRRSEQQKKPQLTITDFGQAVGPALTATGMPRHSRSAQHPVVTVANTYRLPIKERTEIAERLFRESMTRWWDGYREYKAKMKEFQNHWQQWRIEMLICSESTTERSKWPSFPRPPPYPFVITRPESLALIKSRVLGKLKQSEASALLGNYSSK